MTYFSIAQLIQTPIQQVAGLSVPFVQRCADCQIHTLEEALSRGATRLSREDQLGVVLFRELMDYLYAQGLLQLLNK